MTSTPLQWSGTDTLTAEQRGFTYTADIYGGHASSKEVQFVLDEDGFEGQVEHFKLLCQFHADAISAAVEEAVAEEKKHATLMAGAFEETNEALIKACEEITQSRAREKQAIETLKVGDRIVFFNPNSEQHNQHGAVIEREHSFLIRLDNEVIILTSHLRLRPELESIKASSCEGVPPRPIVTLPAEIRCRGCYALGSACGKCASCLTEWIEIYGETK